MGSLGMSSLCRQGGRDGSVAEAVGGLHVAAVAGVVDGGTGNHVAHGGHQAVCVSQGLWTDDLRYPMGGRGRSSQCIGSCQNKAAVVDGCTGGHVVDGGLLAVVEGLRQPMGSLLNGLWVWLRNAYRFKYR